MSTKTPIHSDAAPKAIGPYSQAIIANGFVFCSGQTPIDPATGNLVPGGIEEQTHQVFKNLKAVLAAAGTDLDHVVKSNVFLKDMNNFATMNGIYASYFTGSPPARSTVEVARLPRDCMVEIEMIALLK
ncbi:MAG: RidA family protein [Anaerolineae bacterium]|nr:RidA family protein [Anaerolineae bacterium]